MDLFADEQQHTPSGLLVVALEPTHQYVVICHDDRVETRPQRGTSDVAVQSAAIGVAGVHVQIYDDFVHALTTLPASRYNHPAVFKEEAGCNGSWILR